VQDNSGTVVVVAAGSGPDVRGLLPADAVVIAADGGLDRAGELGLAPALVIGDLDSVSPEALGAAESAGVTVERHPAAKDATDLELALHAALGLAPRRIVVVGSDGGRLDHMLGSLLLLGVDALAGVAVDALVGGALVHVVRGTRVLAGDPGETITLLALHGPARGVTTEGLLYPLRGETLEPGSCRGVSNAFTRVEASVSLASGVLLAIRPGAA
jgi:thiamine pyrophosphokinase